MAKATDETPTPVSDGSDGFFIVRRGDGEYKPGDTIDVSRLDPARVQRMLSTRYLVTRDEWDQAERAAKIQAIREESRVRAMEIGQVAQGKLTRSREEIELRHARQVENEMAAARGKILAERDDALRELNEKRDSAIDAIPTKFQLARHVRL